MSQRTRFEIETFVLGAHPTNARKAHALHAELIQARAQNHPDLAVLEAVWADFSKEHKVDDLLASIEDTEEEYWVQRLAKLAAIDILTIGKVQPEHMAYMASLEDDAFAACVKSATVLAKSLNESVRQIEAEMSTDLVD
jgi:predicted amidohydrolase